MFLTTVRNLGLTRILWKSSSKKKPKAETILVMCESVASTHRKYEIRPRLGDKLEFLANDPNINREVLYKEKKKVKSIRE